jgi:hypothetical protein
MGSDVLPGLAAYAVSATIEAMMIRREIRRGVGVDRGSGVLVGHDVFVGTSTHAESKATRLLN